MSHKVTLKEKCELAISQGYVYDPLTGNIYGVKGKLITGTNAGYIRFSVFYGKKKKHNLRGHQFGWYWVNKECVKVIDHINRVKTDNRICNLRSASFYENVHNRSENKEGFYIKFNMHGKNSIYTFNTEKEVSEFHKEFLKIFNKEQ